MAFLMKMKRFTAILRFSLLLSLLLIPARAAAQPASRPVARQVILLIADGWGANHSAATNSYTGSAPAYQTWPRRWVTTYAHGGSYDPAQAWSSFAYVKDGATDSAAAATALAAGVKTYNTAINVDAAGVRLQSIVDKARRLGWAAGAITTVPISHATPGVWMAHNDSRTNTLAIADEGFWGDPNKTDLHLGGKGLTQPAMDVLIGGGHPAWSSGYVSAAQRDKLAGESGQPGAFTFVERVAGSPDGGPRLLAAANDPAVTRLAGLFGGSAGNIAYRQADGSGHEAENPTLVEMTQAALAVLGRNPDSFALMVEGGAVDWASHDNRMDNMVGEMIGFDAAVDAVVAWVDDPATTANWSNTLVIVTGDHETGYLTAGPGVFPDQPLGVVNAATLAKEKVVAGTGRRASWEDVDGDSAIDAGETVYWAWNHGSHTNSLIPLYAKGAGAELFAQYAVGTDPVRGAYIDNTDVFKVMDAVVTAAPAPADEIVELVNVERLNNGNLPPLKHEAILDSSAQTHSDNMAARDFFMHCDPDTGSLATNRMVAAGYTGWNAAAENIAAGYATAQTVVAGWMASLYGHRENILSTVVRELGVGYAYQASDQATVRRSSTGTCSPDSANSGPYLHYWTQNFGRRAAVYPVVIEREAFTTPAIHVALYVYGPTGATQMRFSNDGNDWSDWQTYSPDVSWNLSAGNGHKRVYAQVTDGSAVYAADDTIYLEAPPPAAPVVAIDGGATPTLTWLHDPANLTYDVYRSASNPYFTPGSTDLVGPDLSPPPSGSIVEFTDDTAEAGVSYFYQVVATAGDGLTTTVSQGVGRFIFALW
jgi:alkaline phosphatase